jgi:FtsP/CotA-like multicopper oxidase with cupredoxin domain
VEDIMLGSLSRRAMIAAAGTMAGSAAFAAPLLPGGPKTTASPGPGDNAAGPVDFTKLGVKGPENFDTFGCKVFNESPNTPDFVTANAYFERKVFTDGETVMPDGNRVRHWGFEDPLKAPGLKTRPSPVIRVQQGDLVHTKFEAAQGTHTLHQHGIQPTTMNDGVGHVSFEVNGHYIYQWQPTVPGTYFYHCHKNTVLHFKMGLYGLLVVDPKPDADGPTKGRVRAFAGGPLYDVEKFWVLDDIDPKYQNLNHDAGLCGEDVGLNIYKPRYFLITGTPTRPKVATDAQKVTARKGEKILIRLLNASYSVLKVTLAVPATIISTDGNPLNDLWNGPVPVGAGEPIYLTSAQRRGLLIDTNLLPPNSYPVSFEYQDWLTRKPHNLGQALYEGTSSTFIQVT